ncbi:MAG: phage head closure protein [Oscillospiraceae bacterium]|nr:phage head closure protein [Oscillospiraceae bacterium]
MARDVSFVLRKLRFDIVDGITQSILVSETPVTGWIKSATRSEFYGAMQAGFEVAAVFRMFSFDYNNAQELEYDGHFYSIVRTYFDSFDNVELICKKRDQK